MGAPERDGDRSARAPRYRWPMRSTTWLLALALAGCASTSAAPAFRDVAETVEARSGHRPRWDQSGRRGQGGGGGRRPSAGGRARRGLRGAGRAPREPSHPREARGAVDRPGRSLDRPSKISLETDAARNAGVVVPLEGGKAALDKVALPERNDSLRKTRPMTAAVSERTSITEHRWPFAAALGFTIVVGSIGQAWGPRERVLQR